MWNIKYLSKYPYSQCPHCNKEITVINFNRHLNEMHSDENIFQCPTCPYNTSRKENLDRHSTVDSTTNMCPGQKRPG